MHFLRINSQRNTASWIMLLFALFAFTLQAILPAGFMPAIHEDGYTRIVICSGMDEKTILVSADGTFAPDHSEDSSGKICAYQLLASAKILLSPPAYHIPAFPVLHLDFAASNYQTPFITIALSFDARGPPLA